MHGILSYNNLTFLIFFQFLRQYKANRRSVTFGNESFNNRSRFGSRISLTSRRSAESSSYQIFQQRWSSLNRNISKQIEEKAGTLKRQFKRF